MSWYNYCFCFFAGMFLANVVPHFVHGISGDPFPTPFAHPPGKGLSSATTNVVWALVNLIVGYVFFRVGKVSSGGNLALAVLFAGIAALSTWLSVLFAKIKQANRVRKLYAYLRAAFPDFHAKIHWQLADGDRVTIRELMNQCEIR